MNKEKEECDDQSKSQCHAVSTYVINRMSVSRKSQSWEPGAIRRAAAKCPDSDWGISKATNGLLPIETKEADTPVYQKYVIDFKRLSPRYLHDVPSTSYEGGGEYIYVLTDVEKKPTVKLLDVKMTQTINELRLRIKMYQDEHTYPPYGKVVSANLYTLNEKN